MEILEEDLSEPAHSEREPQVTGVKKLHYTVVPIASIFTTHEDILCVEPENYSFDMIYRSAMGVRWDCDGKYLYHVPPKSWSAVQWFGHILDAAMSEYDVILEITAETAFGHLDANTVLLMREESSRRCAKNLAHKNRRRL